MVLSFGELLVRLTPDTPMDWFGRKQVNMYLSGSEMNVIAALAHWRMPVSFCTVLPDSFLSGAIEQKIADQNIDISPIVHYGHKVGLYYLRGENTMKDEAIIHDRLDSSFYNLQPGIINWDIVLNGVRWFHFNALSAGLNENTAAVCKEALKACTKKSITVSVSMHHHPELWLNKNLPGDVMPDLLQYCDILISDVRSIETVLGMPIPASLQANIRREDGVQLSKSMSEKIAEQFSRCKIIGSSFYSFDSAAELYGTIYINNNLYVSASYKGNEIVDKDGSADSFTAGFIYGIYNHLPFQQVINFAAGAGFQKLFVKGDVIDKTAEEIKSFMLRYQHS